MSILSIQSHVVYGYAGNSSAVFPLQRLGHETWAINTVEFSNHTGYGKWRGQALDAGLINELVLGLEERNVLNRCNAVLSGYLGSSPVCEAILEAVKKVKNANPAAIYCCDPVMGDTGRGVYVKPDIPDIIKSRLVPHADIICPNQFELELLTGIDLSDSKDSVSKAVNLLHDMGPSVILVTSFQEDKKQAENPTLNQQKFVSMIVSQRKSTEHAAYKITTPYLAVGDNVAGTGDLTSAVFLAHFLNTGNIEKALTSCASSIFGILDKSRKLCYNDSGKTGDTQPPMELKTIETQGELVSPSNSFKAVKINL